MIYAKDFFDALVQHNVTKFSGVPDSLLKSVCAFIADNASQADHLVVANEGAAVALAVGQYLSTGNPSLVYMQNSGFGNAVNPLLSLADEQVYGIPMIVLVGWRGEPGVSDEPQHIKQGRIMEELLAACELPYEIIDQSVDNIFDVIERNVALAKAKTTPVVLLVKKGVFAEYKLRNREADISSLSRESAIREVIRVSGKDDIFVSTTGMPSRELFEIRVFNTQGHDHDFLTVGSMGHASMIALGVYQSRSEGHVFCLDGDGSSIMHLGNFTSVGQSGAENLIHIVLNNAAHDSVGGQPTCANHIDLPSIAKSCGYRTAVSLSTADDISSAILSGKSAVGPHFIEIKVKKGARADLGRPTSTPSENKVALMDFLAR